MSMGFDKKLYPDREYILVGGPLHGQKRTISTYFRQLHEMHEGTKVTYRVNEFDDGVLCFVDPLTESFPVPYGTLLKIAEREPLVSCGQYTAPESQCLYCRARRDDKKTVEMEHAVDCGWREIKGIVDELKRNEVV